MKNGPEKSSADVKERRYFFPDLARALSALAVLFNHTLPFVFVPYREIGAYGPFWKMFYGVFSLGHVAVIVFFVLSGFLIGGEVYRQVVSGRWSLRNYAIKRCVRLYVVLIPALLLTAMFDFAGHGLLHARVYEGLLDDRFSSTTIDAVHAYTLTTFVANLFFLQTILTPQFGSNLVLWSLTNEFWYYVMFASLVVAFLNRGKSIKMLPPVLMFLALLLLLPFGLSLYFVLWMFGAAAAYLVSHKKLSVTKPVWVPALFLFILSMVAARVWNKQLPQAVPDFCAGLAFSTLLIAFHDMKCPSALTVKIVTFFSEISYSLYLVHFPFLCLFAYLVLEERQFNPGMTAVMYMAALAVSALAFSIAVYYCFERHTKKLQKNALKMLGEPLPSPAS